MNWLIALFALHLVGKSIKSRKAEHEEERARTRFPCEFSDELPEALFYQIVQQEAKKIKRIKNVNQNGSDVYCDVISQSGITTWSFSLDFNDYGHLTGNFWYSSDNDDSDIPLILGRRIKSAIEIFLESRRTCPFCHKYIVDYNSVFCPFCGIRIKQ